MLLTKTAPVKRGGFFVLGLFPEWILETEGIVGFSNAHKLVVLCDAFAAAEGAGLDLAGAEADGEVRD